MAFRNPLSAQQLANKTQKAYRRGKFYRLRDGEYIPLSDEYWRTEPDLIFLAGFYYAGNLSEIVEALEKLGYRYPELNQVLDFYTITLINYQSEKKQTYEAAKKQLLQNQFTYERRQEKRKDEVETFDDQEEQRFFGDDKFIITVSETKLSNERLKILLELLLENMLDSSFILTDMGDNIFYITFATGVDAEIALNLLDKNNSGFGLELFVERMY